VGMLRPLALGDMSSPLGKGDDSLRRRIRGAGTPTGTLCLGFTASAVIVLALASFVGLAFGVRLIPVQVRLWAALLWCAALVVVDIAALRRRTMCRISFRRQTPKNLVFRYGDTKGALIWGLDTGLAVTTFRVSAATWALLGLGLVNVVPWWQGAAYGLSFCLPIAAAILLVPRRPDRPDGSPREPHWISTLLTSSRRLVQTGALLSMLAICGALLQAIML
jgi:hypothetical protein